VKCCLKNNEDVQYLKQVEKQERSRADFDSLMAKASSKDGPFLTWFVALCSLLNVRFNLCKHVVMKSDGIHIIIISFMKSNFHLTVHAILNNERFITTDSQVKRISIRPQITLIKRDLTNAF
jgi:hypothetical protein